MHNTSRVIFRLGTLAATIFLLTSCTSLQGKWYFAPKDTDEDNPQTELLFAIHNKSKNQINIRKLELYAAHGAQTCESTSSGAAGLGPGEVGIWKFPADCEIATKCLVPEGAAVTLAIEGSGKERVSPINLMLTLPNILPSTWAEHCIKPPKSKDPSKGTNAQ